MNAFDQYDPEGLTTAPPNEFGIEPDSAYEMIRPVNNFFMTLHMLPPVDGKFAFNCNCPSCGKLSDTVLIPVADWDKYASGKYHVQTVFPYLTDNQREMFLTGMCQECWDSMAEGEEEEPPEGYFD